MFLVYLFPLNKENYFNSLEIYDILSAVFVHIQKLYSYASP